MAVEWIDSLLFAFKGLGSVETTPAKVMWHELATPRAGRIREKSVGGALGCLTVWTPVLPIEGIAKAGSHS